jgi:hypothetical protein
MNELIFNTMKRIVLACALVLAPALTLAEPLTLRLDDGGGARAHSGSPSLGAAIGSWSFSPQFALDIPPSGYDAGPRLTLEGMYGAADLAPSVRLDVGIRGSFAYHSFSRGGGSLWLLEGVPDLKLRFAASDRVGLYGDFGIGLANIHQNFDFDSSSDNTVAAAIQFGFGVAYALNPGLNLLGEVRFDIYTRSGSSTFIALPTIGLEFR